MQNAAIYGIILMLINTLALAVLDISAKTLRGTFDSALIVFIYKFSLFLIILLWVFHEGLIRLKTKKLHLHIIRSILSVAGAVSFFHGIGLVNMSDAAALENIQYVIVAVIGMIFFQEKCTKTKITAIILGFFGAIIVVHPDVIFSCSLSTFSSFNRNYLYIILAISFWSCNTIVVKLLGNTEHNKTQMFYLLFFASIFSCPSAMLKFEPVFISDFPIPLIPSWRDFSNIQFSMKVIKFIPIMASCYFIHGVAYFNALKSELSIVIPFRYTKLIFSAILGLCYFSEVPRLESYIGYFLIVGSGFLLFRAQMRKRKAAA